MRKSLPPKNVKEKENVEGIKLLDLAHEETSLEEIKQGCNNKV